MLEITAPREAALPNILVYIDVRGGLPTAPSLFALAEARRIARLGGASTYAVVATVPLATAELEALARPIAEAGADKLLLCEADDFFEPPEDGRQGRALDAAVLRVPPMFLLFPPGAAATALGPPLAARMGGAFAPGSDFLTTQSEVPAPEGAARVQLERLRPDGRSRRRLDPTELERPIVASMRAGRRGAASGSIQHLEIEVLTSDRPAVASNGRERYREPNPHAPLDTASVLVVVGDLGAAAALSPAALAAQAPPGTVVVLASEAPASILAGCCPDILLKIGPSPTVTTRSPRTRVVLVAPAPVDPAPEDVDILWQLESPADLTVDALGALLREMGEAR